MGKGHDLSLIHAGPAATAGATAIQVGAPGMPAEYAAGAPATIMGVGRPSYTGTSGVFRTAETQLRSDDDMAGVYDPWYWFGSWIDELMIGAGTSDHTVCLGDSGSPLVVVQASGRPVEVGVAAHTNTNASGDDGCTEPGLFEELSGAQLGVGRQRRTRRGQGMGLAARPRQVHPVTSRPATARVRSSDPTETWSGTGGFPASPTRSGWFQIRHSQLCANMLPTNVADSDLLVQGTCLGHAYDLFEVAPGDNGFYRLYVAATDRCLAIRDASTQLRAKVRQDACSGGENQQFDLRPTDGGYYEIVNRRSQLCLDVQGDYTGPGAYVWQYTCDLGYNQQFRFLPAPFCHISNHGQLEARAIAC